MTSASMKGPASAVSELKHEPQTAPGTAGGGGTPPPALSPGGGGGDADQTRRILLFGVIGFLILVFLLVVAFGGRHQDTGPVKPAMPDVRSKGLQYAQDEMKATGNWGDVVAYDATGQDRSLRDRRDWQVCFQAPSAGKAVKDGGDAKVAIDGEDHRRPTDVWLGAVRTNEKCAKLDGNYGIVPRVYDRGPTDAEQGTDVVPNLAGFTAHMARIAFGDDASIRVTKVPNKNEDPKTVKQLIEEKVLGQKAIKTDADAEVGSGWDSWKICSQQPKAGTAWAGKVIELDVVQYADSCAAPTKS